ncbi:methyltransferase domain-containing protein [Halarcobacter sp.]|uniref:methyltransferase domain-containing protein n=1 Tax=Halarcobacter sp. TaxID=2321133 RepID=UPI002AAA80FC|nr:methyltransferase domain-containing protein [Halarcobacter sp.]
MTIEDEEIKKIYNSIDTIWSKEDSWHFYTFNRIQQFIKKEFHNLNLGYDFSLLNAGSAGNDYGISCKKHIHMDLIEKKIIDKEDYLIGSINDIPLENQELDFILCVGSVINYTDALQSIQEFSRVLKKDGYLILEFENSYSLEYFLTENFKKTANIVTTFYKNKEEKVWIYSYKFLEDSLKLNNFKILKSKKFHILSSLIYRFSKNEKFSTKFSFFDSFLSRIPLVKDYSSNVILLCKKV